jgi:FAD:protein FMN transferase
MPRAAELKLAATEPQVRRARPLLGTRVEIAVAYPSIAAAASRCEPWCLDELHAAVDAAFAAIETVDRLMSYHDPASELSRVNREALRGAAQRVDAHTRSVLEAALRVASLSDGAFDPCVAATLEQLGYLPACEAACAAEADPRATFRDIELTADGCVRFHRRLRMDLGGIAKGYAVDLAVGVLERAGMCDICVNAGGDLRIAGPRAQPVEIRHPEAPLAGAHVLELEDEALATSATCFSRRGLGDRQVSALIDPRRGMPYVGPASVSVRARDCMTADALTKVVLFGAPAVAERVLEVYEARAYVLAPVSSPGWSR